MVRIFIQHHLYSCLGRACWQSLDPFSSILSCYLIGRYQYRNLFTGFIPLLFLLLLQHKGRCLLALSKCQDSLQHPSFLSSLFSSYSSCLIHMNHRLNRHQEMTLLYHNLLLHHCLIILMKTLLSSQCAISYSKYFFLFHY